MQKNYLIGNFYFGVSSIYIVIKNVVLINYCKGTKNIRNSVIGIKSIICEKNVKSLLAIKIKLYIMVFQKLSIVNYFLNILKILFYYFYIVL